MRNLNQDTITQAVIARFADTPDPRLKEIMTSLVQHLHAFAREVKLTEDEWFKGIEFLTRVGHMTDDNRQEFILLSDTLGLSMLTVAMNNDKPAGCTEATVFGPFHVEGAPHYELGEDVANGAPGQPCEVRGTVRGIAGEPVAAAVIEVWQADAEGKYDVQREGLKHHQARGVLKAGPKGEYHFKSILAEDYPIPDDGPVGDMLRATARHPWRPAHLHFMIKAPGYETLITHVFRNGDKYLDSDAVFGVRGSLVADWVKRPDGSYLVEYDFVLNPVRRPGRLRGDTDMALSNGTPRARRGGGWAGLACALALAAGVLAGPAPASAQSADLIVTNAKIATLDARSSFAQAMAVRDGKIVAVGSMRQVQDLAGPATRRVDAGGRTVIPGLIDSHVHAVRAALSYATEVNWIGAGTIPEAMERLRQAAAQSKPGAWLIVAGGWTELQFAEKRRPTLAEVMAAAPDNPTYIQLFYVSALMTPKALAVLGITPESLPAGSAAERDASGAPTGWLSGNIVSISALFDRLPKPTFEDNVAGTRQFFGELNRLAVTGVVDPGGFSIAPSQYAALFRVWQDKALTVRVAYSLFAQNVSAEFAEYRNLTQMLPMGFGDDMLRFNGIGERITAGMYNNNQPDAAAQEKFLEIIRWAARQRLTVTIHWQENSSIHHLLDLYEQVNRETPIAGLRWSIAHLDNASPETLARMKALGLGWTMQDAMYLAGDRMVAAAGEAARRMPPIMTAVRTGVNVGAGTDAHRVASYNPFVALQWMLDGKTVGGQSTRGPDETPSRDMALRLYTVGSAWFSFDEGRRGTLEVGKLADFAILDQDYFTVPVERIGRTTSLMTVVGGKVVHAAQPFAALK